jgi:glycosyltransferase involved in cell wall biosynthesis
MRVAIDARELCGRPTGVGRYLTGLLDAWSKSDAFRRHQWTLLAHGEFPDAQRWAAAVKIVPGSGGTSWEQLSLPRAIRGERPDVFFAPGYTAPLTVTAPLVLTIHDVSFFARPEWFSFREGMRRRMLTAWSARRAKRVITDTEFSKGEIARHIGIPTQRITAIPLGIDPLDHRPAEPSRDDDRTIVLFAGSIFERRRVDRLIQSFDAVVEKVPNAELQIVGDNRTRHPRIDLASLRAQAKYPDRIHLRSYVDDATLADLYRRASVFAFLSEYEGFGFTPLEALREGVPPLLLDTPVARETCADAARYVSASAGNDEIAASISDLLTNASARTTILRNAATLLPRYDWNRTAAATLSLLEEAASGG